MESAANVHAAPDHAVAGDLFRRLISAPDRNLPGRGNGTDHGGACLRSTSRSAAAARSAYAVFGLYKHDSRTRLRPRRRAAKFD